MFLQDVSCRVWKSFKSSWPPESRKSRISVIIRDKAAGKPQIILKKSLQLHEGNPKKLCFSKATT
jgi:hypothetical protein